MIVDLNNAAAQTMAESMLQVKKTTTLIYQRPNNVGAVLPFMHVKGAIAPTAMFPTPMAMDIFTPPTPMLPG